MKFNEETYLYFLGFAPHTLPVFVFFVPPPLQHGGGGAGGESSAAPSGGGHPSHLGGLGDKLSIAVANSLLGGLGNALGAAVGGGGGGGDRSGGSQQSLLLAHLSHGGAKPGTSFNRGKAGLVMM